MIIALDGPAGSGKSTIAKQLADKLNIDYLDTGAMYRALTLYMITNNVNLDDQKAVSNSLINIEIDIDGHKTLLNNVDVSDKIRSQYINNNISKVASIKAVRDFLVASQQKIASKKDMILDGRDIGTVVFPDADYKFYINASSEVRARRRVEQNKQLGTYESYEAIKESIEKRDAMDMKREFGPLKCAHDAIIIDTSNIDINETILLITKEMEKKCH